MPKSKTYEEFVNKFKPKLTTDDCYTPAPVYDAIKGWACSRYGIKPDTIVRPFYPGGDYENFEYPPGCCVLDNPPFSILARIVDFYNVRHINYFLFAPGLTCLNYAKRANIVIGADVVYSNGADIATAFVTNLSGDTLLECSPALTDAIRAANKLVNPKKQFPAFEYPDELLSVQFPLKLSRHPAPFKLSREDAIQIRRLDNMDKIKKQPYGTCYLLSPSATRDKLAAEKASRERKEQDKEQDKKQKIKIKLSERERNLINDL